jgi:predicted P-loop ATPase
MVIYDGGKFAYSHHATDPACGKLVNAFDLVRLHKFTDLEDKASFKAMSEFAISLDEVKILIAEERTAQANLDFGSNADVKDWRTLLRYQPKSKVLENSVWNEMLILTNDPDFAGFAYNELANQIQITGKVPWERPDSNSFWREFDTAQIKAILDVRYVPFSSRNHDVAFSKVADDRRFHPIREYFDGLPPWDGQKRVDTLYVDYLGAEDTPYTRAATRKTKVAAVARIKRPGTKFDSVPVLVGPQGIGKSTLISRLGGEWYSDSLSIADMKDKTAAEKVQGNWLMELSEMAGMKKVDVETVKSFASRVDDKYRPSYGRTVENHPRQCVIIGTTNSDGGFLRDVTGNRRFWPIKVTGESSKRPWDLTQAEVDQIWAEAIHYYEQGEELFLTGVIAETAADEQRDAMETDEREGMVREYINRLLPDDWESRNIYKRREFISEPDDPTQPKGTILRTEVSNAEIWCECFGKALSELKPADSYALAAIMVKIDGWERNKSKRRIALYGEQRLYSRTVVASDKSV